MHRARSTTRARGFSLIEMVLSLSLVGMVLASLGTMLAFSMQTVPQADDAVVRITDAALPFNIMNEEFGAATSITSVSSTQIVFQLADRTGDATPETVTYSWSGTPGDPLTRDINSEGAETVLSDVRSLAFEADVTSHTLHTITPSTPIAYKRELSEDSAAAGSATALANSRMVTLFEDQGVYQRIRSDSIPDGALYWTPDYVEVKLEQFDRPGAIRLEVRLLDSGDVTDTALAAEVVRTSDLGSEAWYRIDIPGTPKLDPKDEIGVVLICLWGERTVLTRIYESWLFPGEYTSEVTNDGGFSWSPLTEHVGYRVSGSFVGEISRVSSTEKSIGSIRVSLSPLDATEASLVTTIDYPAPVRVAP